MAYFRAMSGGNGGELSLRTSLVTSKKNDSQTNTGHSFTLTEDAPMVVLYNNYGVERIKIGEHRITDADFESYYRYRADDATSSRVYGRALIVYDVPAGTKIAWDGSYSLNAFGFALANIN